MGSNQGLSIIEAVDNLTALLDSDSLEEIEISEEGYFVSHTADKEDESQSYWIHAIADEETFDVIKDTFRTVLGYLHTSYNKLQESGEAERLVEGVNTIMVLVGEAAKKVEKYGGVFKERVTEFDEYKQLQSFYREKIIPESFKRFKKIPIAQKKLEESISDNLEEVEEVAGVHILNDIDVIKRDHLYELFYLKNEAGHNFYTFELARNLKLSCNFGEFSEEFFGEDPLLQVTNWEDKSLQIFAEKILKSSKSNVNKFYKECLKFREVPIVGALNNALMALMLAACPRNLIRQFSLKGCHRYFHDFQLFLRSVLSNREYQRLLLYPSRDSQGFFSDFVDLVQSLCLDLFTLGSGTAEIRMAIKEIVGKYNRAAKQITISEYLKSANESITKALSAHPSGPVFKALDIVREEENKYFDPLMQGNLPTPEGTLVFGDDEVLLLRIPSPIIQEYIHRVYIAEEYKEFLKTQAMSKERMHHLIVNFQDRTSWKEHARCAALEELSKKAEFSNNMTVVTLAKDTPFYYQAEHYKDLNDATAFVSQFIDHLGDESTGYYFSVNLKKQLFPTFITKLVNQVHAVFFDQKKTLTLRERLDFIELVYLFIEVKLIELIVPSVMSLTSKDGLDQGGAASAALFAFFALQNKKQWTEDELSQLLYIVYGPTLTCRERVIDPQRFNRLYHLLVLLEKQAHEPNSLKPFEPLFAPASLHALPLFNL